MTSIEFLRHFKIIDSYLRSLDRNPETKQSMSSLINKLASKNLLSDSARTDLLLLLRIRNQILSSPHQIFLEGKVIEKLMATTKNINL
jgi:hypothetical protein